MLLSCLSSLCILDINPLLYGGGIVQSLSRIWLFVTPWTAAYQASLSFICVVGKNVLPSIGYLLTLLIVSLAVQKLFNLMQPICLFFYCLCYVAHPSPKNHCSDQYQGVFLVLHLTSPSILIWFYIWHEIKPNFFLLHCITPFWIQPLSSFFFFPPSVIFTLERWVTFSLVNLTVRSDAPSSMNWKRKTIPYLCNLHSVVKLAAG